MNSQLVTPLEKAGMENPISSSFRDPSGFMFERSGRLLRQVNLSFQSDYDLLMQSGLYDKLTKAHLLIPHQEVNEPGVNEQAYKILAPTKIPFVSYPSEWCFSTLKDAALLTLDLQDTAFESGLMLKDASAYNIQFLDGRPIFIDTLSFCKYEKGTPWVAYRQFCQHFLAPLALMAYCDARLNRLSQCFIDGVPLEISSQLLPWSSKFRFGLLLHLHIHSRSQQRYADAARTTEKVEKPKRLSTSGLLGITDSLRTTIRKLKWEPEGTEWADYYQQTNYTQDSMGQKKQLVADYIRSVRPTQVWDLGANTGVFSEIASAEGSQVVSFDIDPAAVEKNYRLQKAKRGKLTPLVLDLTNPTPAFGWGHSERMSLQERGPVDLAMGLALIHHLAIGNNVPLDKIAAFMSAICKFLIIEFVPKSDSQVKRLLASREDVFPNYTKVGFEAAFSQYFTFDKSANIDGSERILYLMKIKT